ncbi:serine aminopeptidase domain-containing protein [Cohaesibacter celericrescens]|uniref:serine aminopeptidase domain-containing protein n=1 Tax=Cohaesibacter celericrescens TaxID=2067669 RepID=UPI00356AF8B1
MTAIATRPLVFNNTVGWLNDAEGSRGVVIAGGHGFEDLCSRRFLSLLAGAISRAGLPVLQFDYPGCGDAIGNHQTTNQLGSWLQAIDNAIDCLKAETGVSDVILIGFRLGALLGYSAASRHKDVAALALLAPPASGKSFMREQVALSRMIDSALEKSPMDDAFDGLSVAGFRLSQQTVEQLKAFDPFGVTKDNKPPASIYLAARPGMAANEGLVDHMEQLGSAVTRTSFDGYDSLMCDPTANQIPLDVIQRCTEWIIKQRGGTEDNPRGGTPQASNPPSVPRALIGPDYEEEPVLIGPAPHMVGIHCRPRQQDKAKPTQSEAYMLLNTGGNAHIGWARGYVETARTLAAHGIASLRIDLPDIGQSEASVDGRIPLYDEKARKDVIRAIDWLCGRGYQNIALTGICSGGHQAFHAARLDKRVSKLVMVNPLCFAWNASYALDLAIWKTYESSKVMMGQSMATPKDNKPDGALSRLRGKLSKRARVLVRRSIELGKSGLAHLTPSALSQGNQVKRWMQKLTARGTKVMMICTDGDLSIEEIDRHFGPDAMQLRAMQNVVIHTLHAADHSLTPLHARQSLATLLIEWDAAEPNH